MTTNTFRFFIFLKLPIAFIAGLKLIHYSEEKAQIKVRYSWWNQNPFRSMFWAVQGMAAELSTGVLCIAKIKNSGKKISMLVIEQKAQFTKKATGKCIWTCTQGKEIDEVLQQAIQTGEPQTIVLQSEGKNEQGETVSLFEFTWSFKCKE